MDGSSAALTIGLDVTDRKALEKQVIDASEIERRNIGRDLHDSLGQELTGLSLLVESLIKGLAEQAPQKEALGQQILKLVLQSVSQVRAMSKGLDPVSLRGGGLASGLRDLAESIHKQSGIQCTLRCQDGVSVEDEAVATHLYRITQEAVNNAVKHAQADRIEIGLVADHGGIRLTICDDGKGLPGDPDDANNGMGMRTMRYRASISGGMLDIAAGESGGTKVTCFIPAARNSRRSDRNTWTQR
jgi:signal transduction histidine kinase